MPPQTARTPSRVWVEAGLHEGGIEKVVDSRADGHGRSRQRDLAVQIEAYVRVETASVCRGDRTLSNCLGARPEGVSREVGEGELALSACLGPVRKLKVVGRPGGTILREKKFSRDGDPRRPGGESERALETGDRLHSDHSRLTGVAGLPYSSRVGKPLNEILVPRAVSRGVRAGAPGAPQTSLPAPSIARTPP
jgi:hypothetical protein